MRYLIFLTVVAPVFLSSCADKPFPQDIFKREDVFKVWTLADIQPFRPQHWRDFQKAVSDINTGANGTDAAFVAGDIVSRTKEKDYDRYLAERSKSHIPHWHEIAGNHDHKTDGGALFREKIGVFHKTAVYGNLLFILMSDEARGKSTTITDETFGWWKNLVENNTDKIIIVMTHAPLEGSSILFSSLKGRKILRSERFTEVLKKQKVDLWLSGHLHLPHFFPRVITRKKELNSTVFVHISSIRPEAGGLKHSESRFIAFYCGTKKVSVFSRDHTKKKWQNRHTVDLNLSKTVVCPR